MLRLYNKCNAGPSTLDNSTTLSQLIQLLSDGAPHSGTELGAALGVSRTAVWKNIKKLQAYGVTIQTMKGQGYALASPLILLDPLKIKSLLGDQSIVLHVFESIGSTNDYAKTLFDPSRIQVCLAEQQTAGRGRFNRPWHSPFGENIYFSLSYPFTQELSQLGGLSLVTGLCLIKTLNELYVLSEPVGIKWPNDILANHQKLAGTLIEMKAESHGAANIVIGIGINVNMLKSESKSTTQPWTSLQKLTGQYQDRNSLVAQLIHNLVDYLERFTSKGLKSFMKEWREYDVLKGKKITLQSTQQCITGEACGINANGYLQLKLDLTGEIQAFSWGDTSIVKE
jgi:BirA family biotin operon repressor/biotin-[acetyl-CoA-carboxylase] ligase